MRLGVTGFGKPSNRYKRAFRALPDRIKQELQDTLEDLCKDPIRPGRRVSKMRGHHNPDIWEARLNSEYRLTFSIDDAGVVTLRNIGTHQIYDNP